MTRSARRGPWLPEEDGALMSLVQSQGPNNWVRISQQIQHRSPKQCRERYHQNLKPSLKHDPISPQEGELIEQMVVEMGKRWAEIARRLGNRSDNAVKNWWNGSMNRRRRNPSQINTGSKQVGTRLQSIPFTSTESNNYSFSHTLRSHQSSNNNTHWSPNLVHDSRAYRPATLQIPSPVHAQDSSTAHNSPNDNFNPRLFNSAFFSLSKSRSASSPFTISEYRPELPLIRPAIYPAFPSDSKHAVSERPLISPALSDISQAASLRHAPSLVSDNQSTYSISPRTISSPRPDTSVLMETNKPTWREQMVPPRPAPRLPDPTVIHHAGQSSPGYKHLNLNPPMQKSHPALSDLVTKDSRMHVSSLLD